MVLAQREEGKLLVACGNRRKTRCPSCSETYRADTFQLIRAGLIDGKNVPETVTGHPKIFVTFTAPSFGPVHRRTLDSDGRPRPCHPYGPHRCGRVHTPDDPLIGQALDPETYDYVGAVTWNALATKLWARTVQLANRTAARLLGIPEALAMCRAGVGGKGGRIPSPGPGPLPRHLPPRRPRTRGPATGWRHRRGARRSPT